MEKGFSEHSVTLEIVSESDAFFFLKARPRIDSSVCFTT